MKRKCKHSNRTEVAKQQLIPLSEGEREDREMIERVVDELGDGLEPLDSGTLLPDAKSMDYGRGRIPKRRQGLPLKANE